MLRLRPYKKCDAEYIAGWVKDDATLQKWSAGTFGNYPLTAEKFHAYYANLENSSDFFELTAIDETCPVGHLFMKLMDEKMTTVRLGFVIVDDSKRGMHYGSKMIRLAARYAFDILGVEKITLAVFESNEAAQKCYLAAGFHFVELNPPKYYTINGEQWHCLEMEMTKA